MLHVPMLWNPFQLGVKDDDLFQYFQRVAVQSLTIFAHNASDLGKFLIRMALGSDTASTMAVQQSILAFSSIHRYNVHSRAVELKISALKALATASASHIGTKEAIQHIAAGMLLLSFEIHQASCTSGQWTSYLNGVKDVIKVACLDDAAQQDSDLAILLDWVYYHDVVARFAEPHWHKGAAEGTPMPRIRAEASHTAPPALLTIQLLSELCDAVSARPTPANMNDHKSYLKILDWKIRNIPMEAIMDNSMHALFTIEVFQLAMLVYLNGVSGNMLNQVNKTQQHIDKAFSIFSRMSSCYRQFPIFVLGCEARRDDQRATVLDLMARTESSSSSRSFRHVRVLLQAVWAQDDLIEGGINYRDRLDNVISRCGNLPTLV
ncbi:uncharacterized protein PAC_15335 [Phialocephala subalpina]|uniref:Uncharacterized protein n=1 Tax=Phialocephala subalpina TaxID=576137 RepID=A0A1L7XK49_9HELO|nr:uncharacterized protein PAC_15335 [Phialocephala subalpina]